jgi:hypothetical protein
MDLFHRFHHHHPHHFHYSLTLMNFQVTQQFAFVVVAAVA